MERDRRRRRQVRRPVRVGLAVVTGGLVAAAVQLAHGPAQAAGAYGATANASGLLSTTRDPQHFPVGAVIEGDGPIAQAALSSTGQSNGFASFPYPGAFSSRCRGWRRRRERRRRPRRPLYVQSDASLMPKDQVKQPGCRWPRRVRRTRRRRAPPRARLRPASVAAATATANVSADRTAGTVLSEASWTPRC